MTKSIFDFWTECPSEARIHPRDKIVFDRIGNDLGFDLRCLPSNVWGPLATARVVLLFLSPGFAEEDVDVATSPEGQASYVKRRQGTESLDSREDHAPGWRWWASRTKAIGTPAEVQSAVAILNIGAYHSRTFDDVHALMALPSSRAAIDFAQGTLFPEAERGERVVICLRKPRAWGLTVGREYPGTLFVPPTTQSGHMVHGPSRELAAAAARKALGLR